MKKPKIYKETLEYIRKGTPYKMLFGDKNDCR